MHDNSYQALQLSKETIDDIINNWDVFTDSQKKEFFVKFQSITHSILVQEKNNFDIVKHQS